MNLAAVWKLPAIFIFENNGYAEATSSKFSVSCGDIANRAVGFGMPGKIVDGHDFFAVYEAAGKRSSGRVTAMARRCSSSSSTATTAISKATPRPIAARTRSKSCATRRTA